MSSYSRFAGALGILAGIVGLLYSIAFVILKDATLYSLFLLLGGIFTSATLISVFRRVRDTDADFALWGLVLGIAASFGSAIHGAYDLANAINPPETNTPGLANLPSQIDPRGFLTFAVAGVGVFVLSWLILRGGAFPKTVAYLGMLSGVLLILIYLGRLIILNPASPLILGPAALEGFIVNPLWYLWLGWLLWQGETATVRMTPKRAKS